MERTKIGKELIYIKLIMLNFQLYNIIYKNVIYLITSYNLTKIYCLGFILGFLFFLQIFTGVLLSFIYSSNMVFCWFSILSFLDQEYGWLLRSFHITGTSFIFFTLYMHILKFFIYSIQNESSFLLWIIGCIIYLLTVVIAFLGYVLPLTQMSYWGLTVFSNILSTVPFIGKLLCYWLWGSEFIQDTSMIKIHVLHVFLPFILIIFIMIHLYSLHIFPSSEPFFNKNYFDFENQIFLMYVLLKDFFLLNVFFNIFLYFSFIYWFFVFHEESFEIYSTTKTSDKIIPEWFFLTIFAWIKCVPSKLGGIIILLLAFLAIILSNAFIVHLLLFFKNKQIIIFEIFFLSIIFILSGFLSTQVTLLYPLLFWLQILVFFSVSFFHIKIF